MELSIIVFKGNVCYNPPFAEYFRLIRTGLGIKMTTENNGSQSASNFKLILRALKHRNYRLFFVGQGISVIGTWMQMAALGWLVYRLTKNSL